MVTIFPSLNVLNQPVWNGMHQLDCEQVNQPQTKVL